MYTNNTGDQINAANKRYIRYRAILFSYDGKSTPIITNVTGLPPAKIYQNIPVTISPAGIFGQAIWPQTTDIAIDNLKVTPANGNTTVTVNTWNTSGTRYKKWTETASSSTVTANHTVGDLVAGSSYVVKKDGNILNTYQANSAGQIVFSYVNNSTSTVTFEVDQTSVTGSPTPTPVATQCLPLPSNSFAWWRAEGNGSDEVNGKTATLLNGVTFGSGKVGQAFNFNGTNSYAKLSTDFLPYPSSGFSFETWFKTSSGGIILGQQEGTPPTDQAGYVPAVMVGTDGKLYVETFWFGSLSPVVSTTAVNDGQYHHVAATYGGGTLNVYLDGVLIKTVPSITQYSYTSDYNYQLGTGYSLNWLGGNESEGWYYFNGSLDEPTFYTRALSAAEVQAIYNAQSNGKCSVNSPTSVPTPTNTSTLSASVSGPANGTVGTPLAYSALASGSRVTGAEIYVSPTTTENWTKIAGDVTLCSFTNSCSTSGLWTPTAPGQYYVVTNGYSDANGNNITYENGDVCTGNPFSTPTNWLDCGPSDKILVTISGTTTNTPTPTPTKIPTPTPTPATGNGLTGSYFNNTTLSGTNGLIRIDPTVNFNWGTGSPATGIVSDKFSVRWTGYVKPQYSQSYTFYTDTNDGVRLWVNNQQIINSWTSSSTTQSKSGKITLVAGQKYAIKMEYYENTGSALAKLSWSSASQAKQIIPQLRLYSQ